MEKEVMERAVRETHADHILKLDQKQAGPEGIVCPKNADHGRMGVHIDGTKLLCTAITSRTSDRNFRFCDHAIPASR